MQTGIFVLSKDITNPTPDRRYRDKWLAAVTWEKDWRFSIRRIEYREKDYAESGIEVKVYELKWLGSRYSGTVEFVERGAGEIRCGYWREDPKAQAAMMELVGGLTLSTDKHDEFLWQFLKDGNSVRDYGDDVLWQLYKAGKITNEDIAAAMKSHEEQVERYWEVDQAAKKAKAEGAQS